MIEVIPFLGRVASLPDNQAVLIPSARAESANGSDDQMRDDAHTTDDSSQTESAVSDANNAPSQHGHDGGRSSPATSVPFVTLSDSPADQATSGPSNGDGDGDGDGHYEHATIGDAQIDGPEPLVRSVLDIEQRLDYELSPTFFDFAGVQICMEVVTVMEPCAQVGGLLYRKMKSLVKKIAPYVNRLHGAIQEQLETQDGEQNEQTLLQHFVISGLFLYGSLAMSGSYIGVTDAISRDDEMAKASFRRLIKKYPKSDLLPRALGKMGCLVLRENPKQAGEYFKRAADMGDSECLVRWSELKHDSNTIHGQLHQAKSLQLASRYSTRRYPEGAFEYAMMLGDARIGKSAWEEHGLGTSAQRATARQGAEARARHFGSVGMHAKDRSAQEDRKRTQEGIERALKKPRTGDHVFDASETVTIAENIVEDFDLQTPGAGPSNHSYRL